MRYIFLIIGLIVVYFIGYLMGYAKQIHAKTFGWLQIDKTRNRFRFELNDALDFDNLPDNPKYVFLRVDPTAVLGRKENDDFNEMDNLK